MESTDCYLLLNEVLEGAASQDPTILKAAEIKLQSFENQNGFYPALINFASHFDVNTNARFMAIVYLKNGVERNWRRGPNMRSIPEQEKIVIKERLKNLILIEPVLSIAVQLAVTIGKIARFDVPKDWPELLPMLMESVKLVDTNKQYRALLTTYQVIKALSTKRLTGDRKLFHEIASEIFDWLNTLWDSLYLQWATSSTSGDTLERAHLALKILRVLCIRGYKVPKESPSIVRFIPVVMGRAKETTELRFTRQDTSPLLQKHITTMWKIIEDFLETHPLSFVLFLQSSLEFASYFGFSEEGRGLAFERVSIHALNLLKGIVLCPEFIAPKNVEGLIGNGTPSSVIGLKTPETDPLTLEAAHMKKSFFSDETLDIIIRVLVTKYLPLTPAELENWSDDPEEFALRMEESGESWKYNMRQSAEVLFVTLFKEFRKSVDILLAILREFEAPLHDPNDRSTIIAKDSLYNAAGLTAYELYDEFSFDVWLHTTLIHELALPVPILHRRITWLVGQWTGVKINSESRPTVFALLLSGLKSNDVVVRLSSSQALRSCLDDFDFLPEQFVPYLQETFFSLFALLKDVKESDNKMRVLHVMGFMIERMAVQIKSTIQLNDLTQYLPMLWNTEHNMLKAAVVTTAIQLVHALGTDSMALKEFLFPVIRISTDLSRQEHVYLLEDALELWLALMEYAPNPPDDSFITLVDHHLIPLLASSTEYLKTYLALLNSYCLIYPELFAERFGLVVVQELASAMKDMAAEGSSMVLRTIENMLRTSPVNGPGAMKPILEKVFCSAYEKMDTPIIISLYLSIAARLLLISEPIFHLGLEHIANSEGGTTQEILGTLTDVLCQKTVDIVQPERKKLLSIALLKLLSTGEQVIVHRICGIFLALSETLNDIVKTDSTATNGKNIDSLYLLDPSSTSRSTSVTPDEETSTENDRRKKLLSSRDVVYTVDLVQLFRNAVQNLQLKLGPIQFNDVMSTVDVETMAMAKTFLTD